MPEMFQWILDFDIHIKNFVEWIFIYPNRKANAFAMITVVLSGLVSWLISALYYNRGNRQNLIGEIMYPLKWALDEPCSWKSLKEIEKIIKKYPARFLKKNERKVIDELVSHYRTMCAYQYERVCAECLFSYFDYKLCKKGINTKPCPIEIEDEIVDWDYPNELYYMRDELAQIIKMYPPQSNNADDCLEGVKGIFRAFAKEHYTNDEIIFFDDYTLDEVITKARISCEWDTKEKAYQIAKRAFLELEVLK